MFYAIFKISHTIILGMAGVVSAIFSKCLTSDDPVAEVFGRFPVKPLRRRGGRSVLRCSLYRFDFVKQGKTVSLSAPIGSGGE